MQHDAAAAVISWAELASQEAEKTHWALARIQSEVIDRLAAVKPPELVAEALATLDEPLARAMILLGPAACLPSIAAVAPYLARALDEFPKLIRRNRPRLAVWMASYVNAVRCCGGDLPGTAADLEARWVKRLASQVNKLDEPSLLTLACAAVATGAIDKVPAFTAGAPIPTPFVPGHTYGPDYQGFVRYLAAAVRVSADAPAIEPAWADFVRYFPAKLLAGGTSWSDLTWCARVVAVNFTGEPIATVGQLLHDMVT